MSIMTRLFCLIIFTLSTQLTHAHPHIWVYTDVKILTESKQIKGLTASWNFDELYSAAFLQDADLNKNMELEPSEAEHTIQTVFKQTPEALFPFVHLLFNGKKHTFTFQNPQIWMAEDETLHYKFSIILDEAASMTGKHEIGFFDPEFYVSFEQNYDLYLPKNVNCEYTLKENENISIYDGLINPETYKLQCKDV